MNVYVTLFLWYLCLCMTTEGMDAELKHNSFARATASLAQTLCLRRSLPERQWKPDQGQQRQPTPTLGQKSYSLPARLSESDVLFRMQFPKAQTASLCQITEENS